jgi:asparagine synthase (glutamine-hydrolysing)
MCGIFGAIEPHFDAESLNRARYSRDILSHRGPDQAGEWFTDEVYLGHRRLSIIDLSETGKQPMFDREETVSIMVNGEIYNHKVLRKELESKGHVFYSSSDCEGVVYGYKEWGLQKLAQKLEGMYVAIIYDSKTRELHIIRDRVGIKPLYYFYDGTRFAFASELKALQGWLGQDTLELDKSAILDFLTYRFIPAPKSAYKNIFKLSAASTLSFQLDSSKLTERKYWLLETENRVGSDKQFSEELIGLLEESVTEQLMSDVPLGFLLSGGTDSSAVAVIGAKAASPALAFSIGFSEMGRSELPQAKQIAEFAGAKHFVQEFTPGHIEEISQQMNTWFDEPFGDTSAVPTHLVSRFARKHVTVALSGDGGDELFGGYTWYDQFRTYLIMNKLNPLGKANGRYFSRQIPGKQRLELSSIKDPVVLYARLRRALPHHRLESWKQRLGLHQGYDAYWAFRKHFRPDLPTRKAAQFVDFHTYLPDDILTKVDRVSMAVALECRPPLLSTKLVEFAFSLPESFIYRNNQLKGGFKYALRKLLPANILQMPKQGFSVPDFGWKTKMKKTFGSSQESILMTSFNYEL